MHNYITCIISGGCAVMGADWCESALQYQYSTEGVMHNYYSKDGGMHNYYSIDGGMHNYYSINGGMHSNLEQQYT